MVNDMSKANQEYSINMDTKLLLEKILKQSESIERSREPIVDETGQNLDLYTFLVNKREDYYHLDQVKTYRENIKNHLFESRKKDKFDYDHLRMFENIKSMSFDINLNSYSQTQFVKSKTHKNHNFFLNTDDKDYLSFYSCVREKVQELHHELIKDLEHNIEKAQHIAKNNVKVFEGSNVPKDEAWASYMKKTTVFYNNYSSFVRNLPGFDKINIDDLFKLSNNSCPIINCLSKFELYIEDEFYLITEGIHITRKFLEQFFSKQVIDYLFEFYKKLTKLNLSRKEMGLLMAYILTSIDADLELDDEDYIRLLHNFYTTILLNEFFVNERPIEVVDKILEILDISKKMKKTYDDIRNSGLIIINRNI